MATDQQIYDAVTTLAIGRGWDESDADGLTQAEVLEDLMSFGQYYWGDTLLDVRMDEEIIDPEWEWRQTAAKADSSGPHFYYENNLSSLDSNSAG